MLCPTSTSESLQHYLKCKKGAAPKCSKEPTCSFKFLATAMTVTAACHRTGSCHSIVIGSIAPVTLARHVSDLAPLNCNAVLILGYEDNFPPELQGAHHLLQLQTHCHLHSFSHSAPCSPHIHCSAVRLLRFCAVIPQECDCAGGVRRPKHGSATSTHSVH